MGNNTSARRYVLRHAGRGNAGMDREPVPGTSGSSGPVDPSRLIAGSSRHLPVRKALPDTAPGIDETIEQVHRECSARKPVRYLTVSGQPTIDNPFPTFVSSVEYWSDAVFQQRLEELETNPSLGARPYRIWLAPKQLDDLGVTPADCPGEIVVMANGMGYRAQIYVMKGESSGVRLSQCLADVLCIRENAKVSIYFPEPGSRHGNQGQAPLVKAKINFEECSAYSSWVEELYAKKTGRDHSPDPVTKATPGLRDIGTASLQAYLLLLKTHVR